MMLPHNAITSGKLRFSVLALMLAVLALSAEAGDSGSAVVISPLYTSQGCCLAPMAPLAALMEELTPKSEVVSAPTAGGYLAVLPSMSQGCCMQPGLATVASALVEMAGVMVPPSLASGAEVLPTALLGRAPDYIASRIAGHEETSLQ